MIYYYNERVSCMKCINGHRAAGCTHVDRDIYTISGRGRPNTRYGKTRYRFLAGTVKFCAMTYVPIFKPGTDNTYTHSGELPTRTVPCLHINPITPFQGVELVNDGDEDTVIYPYVKFDTYFERNCNVSIWDHNKDERIYHMKDGTVASEHPLRSVKANVSCLKYPYSPIVYYRLYPPHTHPRPYHALPHDTPNELLGQLEKLRQKVEKCSRPELSLNRLLDISSDEGFHAVEDCGPIGLRVDPSQYLRVEKKRKGESSYKTLEFHDSADLNLAKVETWSARQAPQPTKVLKQPKKGNSKMKKELFKHGDPGYQQAVSINQHLSQLDNIQRHKAVNRPWEGSETSQSRQSDEKALFEDMTEDDEWLSQARFGVRQSSTSFGGQSFNGDSSQVGVIPSGNDLRQNQSFSDSSTSPMNVSSGYFDGNATPPPRTPFFNPMLNSRTSSSPFTIQDTASHASFPSSGGGVYTPPPPPPHHYYSSSPVLNRSMNSRQPSGIFQATAQGHVQFNESYMRTGLYQPSTSSSVTAQGLPHIDFVLDTRASSSPAYDQSVGNPSTVRDALEEAKIKIQNGEELSQDHINEMISQSGDFFSEANDLV